MMDNQNLLLLLLGLFMLFVGIVFLTRSRSQKQESTVALPQTDGKNIIPRSERSALVVDQSHSALDDISPSDSRMPVTEAATAQLAQSSNISSASTQLADAASASVAMQTPSLESELEKTNVDQLGETLSSLEHATADIKPVSQTHTDSSGNLLDAHLQEQELQDQNSALRNAAEVVSLTVLPNQVLNFDGDTVLQILDAYGLKFGEMNLFHRYEETDGSGTLLFSVMRYTERDGTQPFDLQTLSDETVDGLTFFLPLPHPKASAGVGAMLSMSGSMARDLNATVYDEDFEQLDRKGRDALREFVTDYKVA